MLHVAVLMGGWSNERAISLRSGEACAKALEERGYRVSRVDVGRDCAEVLAKLRPDVAFNALHGPGGEDGTIQGLLELMQIPYTHSGVRASAVAMQKDVARTILAAHGVPVAHGLTCARMEAGRRHVLPIPYVIKPLSEGSSVGVIIMRDASAPPPALLLSADWTWGDVVLAEKYVAGRELTCAVMGDQALGVIDICPQTEEFYGYDAKYAKGGSIHTFPAKIKPEIYQKIQKLSLDAHRALGCRGVSRTDFRYDDSPDGGDELIALEVNTQPGMTEVSLVPELAEHAGYSFGELVEWMVRDASCNR